MIRIVHESSLSNHQPFLCSARHIICARVPAHTSGLYTNYKSFMQLCQHQNKLFFIFRYILMSKLPIYLHQLYDFDTQLRFCRFLFSAYLCSFMHYYAFFKSFIHLITLNIQFLLHHARLRANMRSRVHRVYARIKLFNKSSLKGRLLLKFTIS